jgi:hypothetical protein
MLKSRAMKRVCLIILILAAFSVEGAVAQDAASDLLGRINALRASVGLAPYALSGALNGAATDQAQWIVNNGDVSHTRPDGSGPRSRALAFGYPTSDVSENIYGGGRATANDAWTFWVNSDIHYRGLVNDRYREVGIGVGSGAWGNAYVLVFGNPGGPAPVAAAASGGGGENSAAAAAPPAPPSFIVGADANGNIMHEVQPGDTLGDILLIYGYTWDMLPYLLQLNGIADVRDLEIGSILLVPPQAGTYTPTPGGAATATPAPSEATPYPTPYPDDPMLITPSAAPLAIATSAQIPASLVEPTTTATEVPSSTPAEVAAVPTTLTPEASTVMQSRTLPSWLVIGIVVQVVVLLGAGIEFARRTRKR